MLGKCDLKCTRVGVKYTKTIEEPRWTLRTLIGKNKIAQRRLKPTPQYIGLLLRMDNSFGDD